MSRSRSNAATLRESIEGRTADALALGGEEGRDKLRTGAGRVKCSVIRGSQKGGTRR